MKKAQEFREQRIDKEKKCPLSFKNGQICGGDCLHCKKPMVTAVPPILSLRDGKTSLFQ